MSLLALSRSPHVARLLTSNECAPLRHPARLWLGHGALFHGTG